MVSTFFERIRELSDAVGHGKITGRLTVDQAYAQYQHETIELKHPRGGTAHYLRDPLYKNMDEYLRHIAAKTITPNGSEIHKGMEDVVEDLSEMVFDNAPRDLWVLRQSGHPQVSDDNIVVYDRAPHARRLSNEELKNRGCRTRVGITAFRARLRSRGAAA